MKNMLKTVMLLGILFILTGAVNNDILYPYFDETAKLYGFKNAAGKIIIKPKYIWVGNRFFKNIVGVYEEIYGKVESYYLLRNGRKIAHGKVFFNQDYLNCESENTIKFYDWKKKKAGFLDSQGREIIPAIYDEVSIFRNGVAWALKGATLIQKKIDSHCTLSRWSGGIQVLIDKKNTVLIKNFKYDNYLDWYSLKIREKPSGFENVKSFLGKNGKYYEFYSYELEFKQWLNNEFFKKLNPKTISSYYVKDEKQIDEDVKIMILKIIHEFKNLLKEKGRYFIQKSLDSFPVRKEFAFEKKSYENCGPDSWTRYNVFVLVIEHDSNHSYFQNQFEFGRTRKGYKLIRVTFGDK